MSKKNKKEKMKKSILSKSTNPFSLKDKVNFVADFSVCEVKQIAEDSNSSKSRSKKRNEAPNKTCILDYSMLTENKIVKRYNSRTKLNESQSK